MEDAKRALVASFALSLESNDDLLGYAIVRKIYGFPNDYWDTYPAKIIAVTAADVQRVARKYLNPDSMQVVAVGDASKVTDILKAKGTLEVFDAEGKTAPLRGSADFFHRGREGVDLFERRVDVRRHAECPRTRRARSAWR